MRELNDRFFDAMEEISRACLRRPGGRPRESATDSVFRAVSDGVIAADDAVAFEELKPLRDSLAHNRREGQTLLQVSSAALRTAERLRQKLCGSLPTLKKLQRSVVTVSPDDTVATACALMREHDFTSLPVVSGAGVHGLLTGADIVWWVGGHLDELGLIEDAPVSEVVNAHTSVDYRLVRVDTAQRDIPPMFSGHSPSGCVLGAALITATGHAHEPLLGILTPWDLPNLAF